MANTSRVATFVGGSGTVAGAGTAQSGATALSYGVNHVTTAAGETAVVLPSSWTLGVPIVVVNDSATAALVFPSSGKKINNGSADASFSVAQNKPTVFYYDGTNWLATLSA